MTMAESETPANDKTNNNHPMVANHNHRPSSVKQRKRKRLSQVLDKLTGGDREGELAGNNNNNNNNNNEDDKRALSRKREKEDDDVFTTKSDSPKIPSFSPLRIKEDDSPPLFHRPPACICYQCRQCVTPYDRFFPASPISPLTPASPAPSYSFERYLNSKYLPDIFRRRSHSDSDLGVGTPGGLTSPQEFPLDLSMKGIKARENSSLESLRVPPPLQIFMPPKSTSVSIPVVKGDVASPTTKESVASRYNLEVSPVVEEMPPGSDVAFVCPVCGQMFSLHDRLAKHMASRHKSRQNSAETTAKAYLCEVCKRSFARSDMLTRHMRLHTGVKPYTCRVCGQVFSRSDHLSTHQRTHTGEKPYKCPQCPYAACRRDMITRHMRTHTRYEPDNLNATPPLVVKTENSQL